MSKGLINENGNTNITAVLETERIFLRKLRKEDVAELRAVLGDPEVMYAWEKTFDDGEIAEWIERQQNRYKKDGYGYWASIEKETGRLIGMTGLLEESMGERLVTGVGYLYARQYWGRGFATEGAKGCIDYAFRKLRRDRVAADIRPQNLSSRRVAERLGMKETGSYIKYYDGKEMPHIIYELENPEK